MTFISLRKRAPEPAPDAEPEAVEPDESATESDSRKQEPEGRPPGLLPALYQGVRGWCAWCGARIGAGPTLGIHLGALYAVGRYDGWVPVGVVGGFLLVSALFTPRDVFGLLNARIAAGVRVYLGGGLRQVGGLFVLRKADGNLAVGGDGSVDPAEAPEETVEPAADEPPADSLVEVMWELIGDAPGVHLKTLTEVLAKAAVKEGKQPPTKADVEAALVARKIPTRASVRDAREKVNKGVHGADLWTWQMVLPSTETAPPDEGT
ncbi:hypothetical protein [Streptomyces scabiei]|uniref:hypothetical protein n=1 Tax=Streptomyces scabiei TaxID=1930 RepID=UPI0029B87D7A|nr:hypothetical protein [Streptomyces scabiei]MDX3125726.1 hypothetical protein [Streptomyces scabiei]MDX3202330.1 hypothetical protein [Streptomyces scabiei]MDX3223116.1 hypothetical protein [Streptomyces scabiei]